MEAESNEDYPYTECSVCGEEIDNSELCEVSNRTVCAFCAEFLEEQELDDFETDFDDDEELICCDAIFFVNGWDKSPGCLEESEVATQIMDLKILFEKDYD